MTVEERLRNLVADHLGLDEDKITPVSLFVDDLGADSLDEIELLMIVEDEFGVEIADADAEKIKAFVEALALVEKLTSEKRDGAE